MNRILSTICILLFAATASAQNLSVFNLDASNFPTLKAKFYAFDAQGNQQSPSAPEIMVMENGIMRNVTSVNCPPEQEPKQLSSVLVMDVSGSMGSGSGGGQNIDIAKAAATYWISNVPLGESECAITSFDDHNYFNQDYTTNRNKLANAIAGLQPQNGTDYNAALLLPMSSGLEVTKLGKHQRVIVFLSDGLPNFSPQTSAIIAEAQKQNCMIFSVTVGLPCPQCLKDISTQTGATWFENITSQKQIEEVYEVILHQAQGGSPCEITWKSDVSCSSDSRNVELIWNQSYKTHVSYAAPPSAVAQLQILPQSLYIRSKPVGIKFDTTVTITANNSGFTVTNITSTNISYDINPKSFTLAAGQSKTLTVSYTPPDSNYTWTRFDIATDLCVQTYYASGSYPGHKPTVPTLKLTQPNGGEFLVVGADTVITWKGMPLTDTVKLEYSTDTGSSWNFITDKATGGRYAWHVPKTVSDKCLVRVTFNSKGWARSTFVGDTNYSKGNSIVADRFGNIYVTGHFSGTVDFGGIVLKDGGFFLAKYYSDGSLEWVKQSIGSAEGRSVTVDLNGNIYVTGSFVDEAKFDSIVVKGICYSCSNHELIFIAKYLSDGKIEWVNWTKDPDPWTASGEGTGYSIITDSSGNIYVTGLLSGTANFGGKFVTCTNAYYSCGLFIVKYLPDGSVVWAKGASAPDSVADMRLS